ncbi:MAG: hypothetical protein BJ554DRAFT_4133 [Olpidium bornovanus]|uniref:Uncharacterized protein n=1 Tax=Olpidium bornovanus TaxID=278681 RepID=A0A8H7ZMK7_9FUNG|nr:MAG: hypothetical protein BJ554DRAFT_4133 [Olpidium bornovanus]
MRVGAWGSGWGVSPQGHPEGARGVELSGWASRRRAVLQTPLRPGRALRLEERSLHANAAALLLVLCGGGGLRTEEGDVAFVRLPPAGGKEEQPARFLRRHTRAREPEPANGSARRMTQTPEDNDGRERNGERANWRPTLGKRISVCHDRAHYAFDNYLTREYDTILVNGWVCRQNGMEVPAHVVSGMLAIGMKNAQEVGASRSLYGGTVGGTSKRDAAANGSRADHDRRGATEGIVLKQRLTEGCPGLTHEPKRIAFGSAICTASLAEQSLVLAVGIFPRDLTPLRKRLTQDGATALQETEPHHANVGWKHADQGSHIQAGESWFPQGGGGEVAQHTPEPPGPVCKGHGAQGENPPFPQRGERGAGE